MTTPETWLILLLVLALSLPLARGSRADEPAPPAARLPRGRRPFRPQPPAACPRCRYQCWLSRGSSSRSMPPVSRCAGAAPAAAADPRGRTPAASPASGSSSAPPSGRLGERTTTPHDPGEAAIVTVTHPFHLLAGQRAAYGDPRVFYLNPLTTDQDAPPHDGADAASDDLQLIGMEPS